MKTINYKTYKIKRLDPQKPQWWKDAEQAKVDNFPWEGDYKPATNAWLGTDGDSLFVHMESDETNLRSETKGFGHVHTDSCMEFFVSAFPSESYLNFEFNPLGAMYLAIGPNRHTREVLAIENYKDLFQVKTSTNDKGWSLEFQIPLSFFKRFYPDLELKTGYELKGNFYKCGDKTHKPHYGCWSPIDLLKPDFHCPDYFGTLTFV